MASNQPLSPSSQDDKKRVLLEHVPSVQPPESNLRGYFLLSMPSSSDTWFGQSVVYVCEHSENGALGLVINKPTQLSVPELFTKVDLQPPSDFLASEFVLQGGPVHPERGFVLHTRLPALDDGDEGDEQADQSKPSYKSSIVVGDNTLEITSSKDVLEAIADGVGPSRVSLFLGHAAWGPQQLEKEIADNVWLTTPADLSLIFDTPVSKRYQASLALLGISDWASLIEQAGHG